MKILIIEDEQDLRETIRTSLLKEKFVVETAADFYSALDKINDYDYDCILLDIMLPGGSGLDLLRELKRLRRSDSVLIISAKDSLDDKVDGLELGADDYLIKPFAFEELLARIRAMLRKREGRAQNRCQAADLTVDLDTRTVMRGNIPITLSSKEFSILEYLITNQGIVLSRDRIEQHIWNYDYEGGSNVVDVYIRYLRKKIDDGFEPKLIHTVRGAGYVLRVPEKG